MRVSLSLVRYDLVCIDLVLQFYTMYVHAHLKQ